MCICLLKEYHSAEGLSTRKWTSAAPLVVILRGAEISTSHGVSPPLVFAMYKEGALLGREQI